MEDLCSRSPDQSTDKNYKKMIPDGPTFVLTRQELQQKQTSRDILNIWRDGGKDGTISAINSLLGRDSGRQRDLRKDVIIGGEREWSFYLWELEPASQPL